MHHKLLHFRRHLLPRRVLKARGRHLSCGTVTFGQLTETTLHMTSRRRKHAAPNSTIVKDPAGLVSSIGLSITISSNVESASGQGRGDG